MITQTWGCKLIMRGLQYLMCHAVVAPAPPPPPLVRMGFFLLLVRWENLFACGGGGGVNFFLLVTMLLPQHEVFPPAYPPPPPLRNCAITGVLWLGHVHWASKETYSFLEWCPLKSTASKWMIFRLVLATVLLINHVKKQWNRKCQKWDKCLQITTSPISKITETAPFPAHRLRTFQ